MSYHMTIGYQPEGTKYPFALNTEADQIPLTVEELAALLTECEFALAAYHRNQGKTRFTRPQFIIKEVRNERPTHA